MLILHYLCTPDPALFPHMISFQSSPTIMVAFGANPHCEQMCNTGAGSGLVGTKSLVTTYNAHVNLRLFQIRAINNTV